MLSSLLGFAGPNTNTPQAPVDSQAILAVAVLAAVRREIQQDLAEYSTSVNPVQTSQSIAISAGGASSPIAVTATPAASTNLIGGLLGGVLHILFNRPPTTSYNPAHNVQAAEGAISGTLNAADPDGDPLTFTVTQAPQHGTVVVNAPAGTFTYTPDPAFAHLGGTDTFTVRVSDNHPTLLSPAGVITKTVSVTVSPVNHAPAVGDPAYTVVTVNPNNGLITGTVNVTDQDNDTLTYSLSTAPDPAKGAVVVDPTTGNWTYTPTLNARLKATDINATPADQQVSFTISASDGQATTPVAVNTVVQPLAITEINVGGDFTDVGVAVSPDSKFVYVPRYSVDVDVDSMVAVIDTSTNTVVATVVVDFVPDDVAISPDGARVYVPGFNRVSVIDTATNTVSSTLIVSGHPYKAVVSPDGGRVYVANFGGDISVIDTATNTVTATIPIEGIPGELAISPDGTRVYLTGFFEDNVTVIDTATNTVTATIPVSEAPPGVAVSPDGTRAYVASGFGEDGGVSVIDTATNTVITTISLGSTPDSIPNEVAFSPDGTLAYVTNRNDTMSVIDTATTTVIATIAVGDSPDAVAVSPDGTHVYIASAFGGGTVSVITLG